MKLLIAEIFFILLAYVMKLLNVPYDWVPIFVLAPICTILLTGLSCNIPILGQLAARIEGGRHLVVLVLAEPFGVDQLIIYGTTNKMCLRVLHSRCIRSSYYRTYLKVYKRDSKWIKNL